ncbi:hypothetical protein [Rheinheimera baltica]|uniref:hypothetical protein n=1 Tax=Rheinheimera baltica TaxID=67576 RepID=UPI000427C7D0|nr:hypothetical protein [Rheinheimera baltica]
MNTAKLSPVETTKSNQLIDTVDNLNRLTGQARAVVTSLCSDDNFKTLNEATLANLLWLLGERLDDIDKQIKQIKLG